jgi:L-threonylcarbamoyladenylate synthase
MSTLAPILAVSPESLAQAAALLRSDKVCAFPTETVYGLGANAQSEQAVLRIYELKGRPRHNPLIVHVADLAQAQRVTTGWSLLADRLAQRFWPGPLSLVLPRGPLIPALVSAGLSTVAVRVPAHPVALALLRAVDLPLAAPSANKSESVSPTTAQHVQRSLPQVPLILDGGPCRLGIESTVVDLTASPPRLLRPGALPLRLLLEEIPDLQLPSFHKETPAGPLPSPGLLSRHYAPSVPLHLIHDDDAQTVAQLPSPRGLLTHQQLSAVAAICHDIELLPPSPDAYAADLYSALHRLDDKKVRCIVVLRPREDNDWRAVIDRLDRAAVS